MPEILTPKLRARAAAVLGCRPDEICSLDFHRRDGVPLFDVGRPELTPAGARVWGADHAPVGTGSSLGAAVADLERRCALRWLDLHAGDVRAVYMLGRLADGSQLDHGTLRHLVRAREHRAFCGREPGRRSVGWSFCDEDQRPAREVTCPRCLRAAMRLARREP